MIRRFLSIKGSHVISAHRYEQGASTQTHLYSYGLWDSYQQTLDDVTTSSPGRTTTTGQSVRDYDEQGQLTHSTDSNGQNSVDYLTSRLDGIRARKDKTGETSYLHVAGKTIGDLTLDKNGATHLTVYGGFTPTGTQEAHQAMMPSLWHKKYLREPTTSAEWPNVPQDNIGAYTLQSGDTLDSIALQVYGDASLWYLIADAIGITDRNTKTGESGSSLRKSRWQ